MKFKFLNLLLIVAIFIQCTSNENSIEQETTTKESINKILCIGDSRVQGFRPFYESYRFELWKQLVNAKYDIDFIGPFKDFAIYPTFLNLNFDEDHAGIAGDTTAGVLERYAKIVDAEQPDFVLLGIGGNDILAGKSVDSVVNNISSILDKIKNNNENAIVLVEIIAGAKPNSFLATALNDLINEFESKLIALSTLKTTANFKVVTVNMNANFTQNSDFYADTVHYSELGAKEVATRYFNSLTPFLNR